MADASALPTDDAQQPGLGTASPDSPSGVIEAPGEASAPGKAEAAEGPQAEQAPEPEGASPDPTAPQANPAEPAPGPSIAAIPSGSSPEPAPAPGEPVAAESAPQPAVAPWGAVIASEPEPVAPEPAPLPEPAVVPVTPPPVPTVPTVPTVATTIDIPARGDAASSAPAAEGGEWALLLSKLQAWLGSGQLQAQLQAVRTPLTLVAGLIGLLVVLQIYGALLAVIDRFPLAPGLLELVGVVAVVRFGLDKLVRSQERRALIEVLQLRWNAFRGKA